MNQSSTITQEQGQSESGQRKLQPAVMHLYVVLDCERPHDGASRYALDSVTTVKIGRDDRPGGIRSDGGSVLSVKVRDGRVSREHAQLHLRDGEWLLEDLGSKNGIWVNGRKVDGSTILPPGAIIEAGSTFLTLRPSAAPPLADVVGVRAESKPPGLATIIPELVHAFDRLSTHAQTNSGQVAILGETGVGKELAAHAYHQLSGRSGAFNAVNCSAMPDGLVEAQLFGHKKGAFSGAAADNPGFVRAAEGGTLFLDEIGDLPLVAQAKLLRVVEVKEVTPVGTSRPVPVDVRIVCATHRDIPTMVDQGTFRADLWARLRGFVLELPPLRARTPDFGLVLSAAILRHAPDRAGGIRVSTDAARSMLMRRWPENIRELTTAISNALSLGGTTINEEDLPPDRAPRIAARSSLPGMEPVELKVGSDAPPGLDAKSLQFRAKLEGLLQQQDGNVSKVAEIAGMNRSHLHEVLKKMGLDPKRYRRPVRGS